MVIIMMMMTRMRTTVMIIMIMILMLIIIIIIKMVRRIVIRINLITLIMNLNVVSVVVALCNSPCSGGFRASAAGRW